MVSLRQILMMVLVVTSSVSCVRQVEIEITDAFFNPRLRADGNSLTAAQMPTVPWNHPSYFGRISQDWFSDGGVKKEELVTELSPVLPGGTADQYRNTYCYWLTDQDEIKLYWEVVADVFSDGFLNPQDEVFAGCFPQLRNGYHPYDRRNYVNVNGASLSAILAAGTLNVVRAEARTYSTDQSTNRYGSYYLLPTVVNEAPSGFNNQCAPDKFGLRAACMIDGCSMSVAEDTTFFRSIAFPASVFVDGEDPKNSSISDVRFETNMRRSGPHLKVVNTVRTIARELSFDPIRSAQAKNGPIFSYGWETEDLAGGLWAENFSPNLAVIKMRVFIRRGGLITYLKPDLIYYDPYLCHPRWADFNRDYDIFNDCEFGGRQRGFTPTYAHMDPKQKLSWKFDFNRDPREYGLDQFGNEVETPQGELFVEFVLADVLAKVDRALYTNPGRLEFGTVAEGFTRSNDLMIQNVSPSVHVELIDIKLDGVDADNFKLSPVSLPVTIDPNGGLPIRVTAKPAKGSLNQGRGSDRSASVVVTGFTQPGNVRVETQTQLNFEAALGPYMVVSPERIGLQYELPKGANYYQQYVQAFLVENCGTLPITRDALYIEDHIPGSGHAQAFFLGKSFYDWSTSSVIQSATSEDFKVAFVPHNGAGEYSADLVVKSDADNAPYGEMRILLNGWAY